MYVVGGGRIRVESRSASLPVSATDAGVPARMQSRRKSWRVSTNSRSGVFAVTVAVRSVSSSKAISPTNSPSPRVATRSALR
jgi:hypothetical protein